MQHRSRSMIGFSLLVGASVLMAATAAKRTADVSLASLDLAKMRVHAVGGGRGGAPPQNVAQANKAIDGRAIHLGGTEFAQGVGTRATSVLFVSLAGGADRFTAMVGADDGIKTLVLQVKPAEGNRAVAANWADAKFVVSGQAPMAMDVPFEPREILTPVPGPAPRINGPSLTGVTPGHDVLYKIPVTGTRPMTYSVSKLPTGLTLDAASGIIHGTIAVRGRYPVTFTAKNSAGSASKPFTFVAEGQLSLTPAMGWNSWNAYGRAVSDSLARAAADAMVSKGLIDHGWAYVNLDDGWERSAREADPLYEGPVRAPDGTMLTNTKFPDMKGLGDYIHAKGLKYGIYSGPGPTTCQRLEASWQHELQDFQTFASWGVDYLKYDWCGFSSVLAAGETNTQMDAFELNLVTNDEVLGVHQDALGKAADRVARDGEREVWSRPLSDGSLAVGLFNRDEMDMPVTVTWEQLGIKGEHTVRDLWRQKDVGSFDGEFSRVVPRHGTLFVRVSR